MPIQSERRGLSKAIKDCIPSRPKVEAVNQAWLTEVYGRKGEVILNVQIVLSSKRVKPLLRWFELDRKRRLRPKRRSR